MQLLLPHTQYKQSFIDALLEYKNDPSNTIELVRRYQSIDIPQARENFSSILQPIEERRFGINLPSGWIPSTEFWIIHENSYLGTVLIRHDIPPLMPIAGHIGYAIKPSARKQRIIQRIFPLILKKAHSLALKEVLISAYTHNLPSVKILENAFLTFGSKQAYFIDSKKLHHRAFFFRTIP